MTARIRKIEDRPSFSALIFDGLATQSRVIHALMLREIKTRFGKERLGYLWAFIEPAMYILVFLAILSFRQRPIPGGMPIVLFLITGITPFMLFQGVVVRSVNAVSSNQQLLFFPQVRMLDFFLSRVVLEFITWIAVFFVLCFSVSAFGIAIQIENLLGVVGAIFLTALLAFGFGMTLGALAPLWPTLERLVPYVFIKPLFFTSGLFFTAGMVPTEVREILLLNALLHLSEMLRTAFFRGFESQYADPSFVITQTVLSIVAGMILLSALRQRILAAVRDH